MIVCSVAVPPDALEALCREVVGCRRCPRLVEWRETVPPRPAFAREAYWRRPVPAFGDPAAGVVVVGLAPAAHGGNRTGRMFTGDRSGDWLFRALWRAGFASQPESTARGDGLELHDVWVTASVHCAPPGNAPNAAERAACRGYLERELELFAAAPVVVALGGLATEAVAAALGVSPRPRFAHLAEHPLPRGRLLICSYHPSQQNTFTRRLTEEMFDAVFARAAAAAAELRPAARPGGGAAPRRRSRASASG